MCIYKYVIFIFVKIFIVENLIFKQPECAVLADRVVIVIVLRENRFYIHVFEFVYRIRII